MNAERMITKTEGLIFTITAVFLCSLLMLSTHERTEIRKSGVETDWDVSQETFLPDVTPVDLNAADAQMLDELPGIGEVLAQRILSYREEHGGFESVDELLEVSGIGPKTMEGLRERVTVNGGNTDEDSGSG